MGGRGSGRRTALRGERTTPRQTTDQVPALDVRSLKRNGMITPGQERIGDGSERIPWIRLAWIPCNYGGSRPWFLCPGCDRRAAILYVEGGRLLCRPCLGLSYPSQRRRR